MVKIIVERDYHKVRVEKDQIILLSEICVSSQFFGDKEHRPEGLSGSTRLSKKPSGRSPAFLRRYKFATKKNVFRRESVS
jgi:hypothetical protein